MTCCLKSLRTWSPFFIASNTFKSLLADSMPYTVSCRMASAPASFVCYCYKYFLCFKAIIALCFCPSLASLRIFASYSSTYLSIFFAYSFTLLIRDFTSAKANSSSDTLFSAAYRCLTTPLSFLFSCFVFFFYFEANIPIFNFIIIISKY